ncbi:hypothetical protein BVRB_4g090270 [Beta vulgaris subsp. vulgaris]|nr:hypothetical protein BVRB_4g090270 [Beta vulgaris subsp. vulgaris]
MRNFAKRRKRREEREREEVKKNEMKVFLDLLDWIGPGERNDVDHSSNILYRWMVVSG